MSESGGATLDVGLVPLEPSDDCNDARLSLLSCARRLEQMGANLADARAHDDVLHARVGEEARDEVHHVATGDDEGRRAVRQGLAMHSHGPFRIVLRRFD